MIEALLTLGGSATAGFIFQLIGNWQKDKADTHKMLIANHTAYEKSMEQAKERGGKWMRRFVVFIMVSLFAYLSVGNPDIPTNIVQSTHGTSYLFGLFETSPETIVTEVKGSIMDDTLRTSILSIIAFLFGADVGERK